MVLVIKLCLIFIILQIFCLFWTFLGNKNNLIENKKFSYLIFGLFILGNIGTFICMVLLITMTNMGVLNV